MKLRTITEFVRLLAAMAIALRAGVLLHRTLREEVAEELEKAQEDDTVEYPPGSLGDAIQKMSRHAAERMAHFRAAAESGGDN